MNKSTLANVFFFAVFIFILYEAAALLEPFFGALMTAAILAVIFYPMHRWIGRKITRRPMLQAMLSDFAVFIFFVVPLGLMLWAVVVQAEAILPAARETAVKVSSVARAPSEKLPFFHKLPPMIRQRLDTRSVEVQERLTGMADKSVSWIARAGSATVRNTFELLMTFLILLFALFFFFRDGPAMYAQWNAMLPLSAESRKRIDSALHETILGVVRGTFVTSLLQGFTAALGFFIAGNDAAIVLGFMTFIATVVPSVGTALIWGPVAIYYFFIGPLWKGIFVLLWGLFVIGLMDNILRPYLVGSKAEMPFFWLFFALLGGLEVFGIKGLVLGPLIMSLVPVFLDIYRTRYLEERTSA